MTGVYLVSFTEEEIELVHKAAMSIGRPTSGSIKMFAIERAEEVLETQGMLDDMYQHKLEEYERSEKDAMFDE